MFNCLKQFVLIIFLDFQFNVFVSHHRLKVNIYQFTPSQLGNDCHNSTFCKIYLKTTCIKQLSFKMYVQMFALSSYCSVSVFVIKFNKMCNLPCMVLIIFSCSHTHSSRISVEPSDLGICITQRFPQITKYSICIFIYIVSD